MRAERGFSLVELAIVLVIIGLIVGGILTGQDLIKASELNSVISEKNKYKTAYHTFKLKYNALPGDINNATSYWSGTANGNNDGRIATSESYRAWQQLALAGLIPGSYTGTHTGSASVIDVNTPASTFKPGGWGIYFSTTTWIDISTIRNKLSFGIANGSGVPRSDIMTPQDGYSIDAKIDDGLPAAGRMWGGGNGVTDCSSGTSPTATYNLSLTTNVCGFLFLID